MDLSSPAPVICNSSLENWKVIGSGGFGQVHRARHVDWAMDVAIKLLSNDDGSSSSLHNEADLMRKAGASLHVIKILGVYQGCPPNCGNLTQLGLVMEFMERGTLESLLDTLSVHPPWPLSFRMAHEIALGMNFLHRLSPPLLHQDLKPNNVLLDDSLKAKLADFGLARVSHSASRMNKEDPGKAGGTCSYMPPEALDSLSYHPIRAFDIYSYGILLWSIITGQSNPYPYVQARETSRLCLLIKMGQRPSLEAVDGGQAEGLGELVELMKKCWDQEPSKRPPFKGASTTYDCLRVTERLFEKHKIGIPDAVHEVLTRLTLGTEKDSITAGALHVSVSSKPPACPKVNIPNDVKTGLLPPTQVKVDALTSKLINKGGISGAQFVDDNMIDIIQRATMVMPIADSLLKKKIIQKELYSKIYATSPRQEQMRLLYEKAIESGGTEVKTVFYNILLEQQYHLVKDLGGVELK